MNYYNVLATDFFELAMGYNRFSDDFDANGNGLADDWVPPNNGNGTWLHTSGWYNPPNNKKPNLNGWGDDFVNNRIYWDPLNKNNPLNGKVIWSDSSDLIGAVNYSIGSKTSKKKPTNHQFNRFPYGSQKL